MLDIIRDSAIGASMRFLTRNRVASYPEDMPNFRVPQEYLGNLQGCDSLPDCIGSVPSSSVSCPGSRGTLPSQRDQEKDKSVILVDWYTNQDPQNPYNWSFPKRMYVSVVLLLYTFSAYIGSSIYTTAESDVYDIFHVGKITAALGLSLYVFAYSLGPMIWSPLSEVPAIGRNSQYIITFLLFVLLCIPTALVHNFGGLLILRFLLGFFCSPALATVGASYGDFWRPEQMPYVIALWGGGATLGPALGPVVSGYAVQIKGWRWSAYELLLLSGPVMVVMLFTLPETSKDTILYYRARRLRQLTGRADIRAASEIRQTQMSSRAIVFDALIKPWQINALDPAVLFTTVYTALTYGIYYSFFEVFPLVYVDTYHFNTGELGLTFLSVLVGLVCAVMAYCGYYHFVSAPKFAKAAPDSIQPEDRIVFGLFATFCIPVGLFIFAWTSQEASIHWIVSLLGVAISMFGVFIITQCMFIYLPFTYPRYSGSLFAANGFARGLFAAGAILFAGPMFERLKVSGGVSLLGGLTVLCVIGMYCLYFYGRTLRSRSRFAVS